jgi:hypothetical protein
VFSITFVANQIKILKIRNKCGLSKQEGTLLLEKSFEVKKFLKM